MTTLKEAIDKADADMAGLRPPDFSMLLRSFDEAAARTVKPFGLLPPGSPEIVDLDEIVRKAKERGIAGDDARESRLLAGTLWRRVDGGCIAEDARLLEQYLRTVKDRSHFRVLAWSYLWHFAQDGPGFSAVAEALRNLEVSPPEWRERHKRGGIFADADAPRKIARHFMSAEAAVQGMENAARQIGLDGMLAHGGMSRAAFCAALREYAGDPKPKPLLRLIAWRNFSAKGEGFCNSDYAEGILRPWVKKNPSDKIRKETLQTLLDSHGDPRLHQVNWAGVRDDVRNVMSGWLALASIEQFFDAVEKIGGDGAHMLPKQRIFWLSQHKRDKVSNAWGAFGAGLSRTSSNVACAEIRGATDRAALLVQIGGKIIAYWDRGGKCILWEKGNKHAPQFFQRSYSVGELHNGGDSNTGDEYQYQERWEGIVKKWTREG